MIDLVELYRMNDYWTSLIIISFWESIYSLSRGTERSSDFEIISNITGLVLGVQLEVIFLSLLSLGLDVEILVVIPVNALTLLVVKSFSLSGN